MEIGLCASPESLRGASLAGCDFMEVNVQAFLAPEAEEAVFETNLAQAGELDIPIKTANCFLPAAIRCVGPDRDPARLERYAAVAFHRAARAGIDCVVFGSGKSRQIPEGFPPERAFEEFVQTLKQIGPIAREHEVLLVVEPLNRAECNFINSLEEGAEVVEACGHPQVRLLADFYHMAREDEPAEEILSHGQLLAHAHLAERQDRTPPGVAGDDFSAYLDALRQIAYRGRLALECKWQDLPAQASPALASLRAQMVTAGLV